MRQREHAHFVDLAWVRGSDSPGASCGARKCRGLDWQAFGSMHAENWFFFVSYRGGREVEK